MGLYIIVTTLYLGICWAVSYVILVAFKFKHQFWLWMLLWLLIAMIPAWDFLPAKLLMAKQCKADAGAHIYETRSGVGAYKATGISVLDPKRMVVSSLQRVGGENGYLVYMPLQQKGVFLREAEVPATRYLVSRSYIDRDGFFKIRKEVVSITDEGANKKIAYFINYEKWVAPFSLISSSELYGMTPFAYLSMGDCFDGRYMRLWHSDVSVGSKEKIIYKMIDEVLKSENQ